MAPQPDEKRESGVNPERSGHCIQGVSFDWIHCTFTVWEGKRYMLICKSGNLLSTWGETSDESSVPDRKVFALCLFGVSAFGSRHFLFMECARCGTVQAAGIWILNIHFDFWSDRSWRHSACYAGKLNVPHQNPSKSDILLPNEFAYIINQPQYLIRPLQHLSQWCSDFSISFHSGLPAASRWGNERGLDILVADVFLSWVCVTWMVKSVKGAIHTIL